MPPLPTLLLIHQPCFNLSFINTILYSHSNFLSPSQHFTNRTFFSSTAAVSSGGGGRTGDLSPSSPSTDESMSRIDVNPSKGTSDFAPDDMRLQNVLFGHFREVSSIFGFEEVDFPVLESKALFIRKASEEIRDQKIRVPSVEVVCFGYKMHEENRGSNGWMLRYAGKGRGGQTVTSPAPSSDRHTFS